MAEVIAVCRASVHQFTKAPQVAIHLVAGIGVEGDAHAGALVRHRSRVRRDPTQPNLRQVHLLPVELFAELAHVGFQIAPGDLGENCTTQGMDLLNLPRGALLQLGSTAVIEITGLRNPCVQLDRFQPGLMQALLEPLPNGQVRRKCGVMAIVRTDGWVSPGDPISLMQLPEVLEPLDVV